MLGQAILRVYPFLAESGRAYPFWAIVVEGCIGRVRKKRKPYVGGLRA